MSGEIAGGLELGAWAEPSVEDFGPEYVAEPRGRGLTPAPENRSRR